MNTPLISIIVPAYNIASYLPRCLDSLIAQSHRNLEIIVVNDGSSDDTGAIIDAVRRATIGRIENLAIITNTCNNIQEKTSAFFIKCFNKDV